MILIDGREIGFTKFPNGETKVIEDTIIGYVAIPQNVHFKYEGDESLIRLMLVKRYLDSLGYPSPVLTIYYMPYSRMDRSENESAFTLKYVADFINSLNFKKIVVIEPHSDVTCAVLNNAKPRYLSLELLNNVQVLMGFDSARDFLFFPDAGAQKRYHSVKGYKQLVGYKNRDFTTGMIKSLDVVGDLTSLTVGSKALIVDDLSSYGTTFITAGEKLRELGFKEIYLFVPHAEDSIFKPHPVTGKILPEHMDKIFTTDSILSTSAIDNWGNAKYKGKVTVFKLKDFII